MILKVITYIHHPHSHQQVKEMNGEEQEEQEGGKG